MKAEVAGARRILLVEDDEVIRGAMKMILEWEGYRVACAANGQEALDLLRRTGRPGLILLDLMMPVLDGWEFLRERQADPALSRIPVIVVTGVGEDPEDGSVAAQVHKPFQPQELLEAIRRQR